MKNLGKTDVNYFCKNWINHNSVQLIGTAKIKKKDVLKRISYGLNYYYLYFLSVPRNFLSVSVKVRN